jgi:hypothetical protein
MYLNNAITALTCGAALSLLSLGLVSWVPKAIVLLIFGSGVFLLAFGWVITLFMAFRAIIYQDVESLEVL